MQLIGNPALDRTQVATAMVEDLPVGGIFMSVIVSAEGSPATVWDQASLECVLAHDLILASGGVAGEISGPALVARFDSIASAAKAARRLQWAAQGLADATRPYNLSILLQAGEEVERAGIQTPPSDVSAGGIFVSDAAAHLLEEVPGYAVRPKTKGAAFREMAWRAAANLTTRDADERALAHLAEQTGRVSQETRLEPAPVLEPVADTTDWSEEEPRRGGRTLLWVGLAILLVAGAIGGYLYLRPGTEQKMATGSPAQQTSEQAQNPVTTSPATSSPATATSGNPAQEPSPHLTKKQQRELERQQKQLEKKTVPVDQTPAQSQSTPPTPKQDTSSKPPEVVSGGCPYSSEQLPGLLDSAETARGRGKYPEALRKVNAVLACQPGNGKARDLKEQIQRAIAAQNGSDSD